MHEVGMPDPKPSKDRGDRRVSRVALPLGHLGTLAPRGEELPLHHYCDELVEKGQVVAGVEPVPYCQKDKCCHLYDIVMDHCD